MGNNTLLFYFESLAIAKDLNLDVISKIQDFKKLENFTNDFLNKIFTDLHSFFSEKSPFSEDQLKTNRNLIKLKKELDSFTNIYSLPEERIQNFLKQISSLVDSTIKNFKIKNRDDLFDLNYLKNFRINLAEVSRNLTKYFKSEITKQNEIYQILQSGKGYISHLYSHYSYPAYFFFFKDLLYKVSFIKKEDHSIEILFLSSSEFDLDSDFSFFINNFLESELFTYDERLFSTAESSELWKRIGSIIYIFSHAYDQKYFSFSGTIDGAVSNKRALENSRLTAIKNLFVDTFLGNLSIQADLIDKSALFEYHSIELEKINRIEKKLKSDYIDELQKFIYDIEDYNINFPSAINLEKVLEENNDEALLDSVYSFYIALNNNKEEMINNIFIYNDDMFTFLIKKIILTKYLKEYEKYPNQINFDKVLKKESAIAFQFLNRYKANSNVQDAVNSMSKSSRTFIDNEKFLNFKSFFDLLIKSLDQVATQSGMFEKPSEDSQFNLKFGKFVSFKSVYDFLNSIRRNIDSNEFKRLITDILPFNKLISTLNITPKDLINFLATREKLYYIILTKKIKIPHKNIFWNTENLYFTV